MMSHRDDKGEIPAPEPIAECQILTVQSKKKQDPMRSTLFLAVFLHLALHALAANPEDAKWLAENAKKPGVMITASGKQTPSSAQCRYHVS